jgi:hypothetical protein
LTQKLGKIGNFSFSVNLIFFEKILENFQKNEEIKLCLGTIKYCNIKFHLIKKKENFEDWKMKKCKLRYRIIEGDNLFLSLKSKS